VFQPDFTWLQLPLNTYYQGTERPCGGGQWQGSGAAWGKDLPQPPCPPHPEVTGRTRPRMAMGTSHLRGHVKETRVGSAREVNREEYSCSTAQAGHSTRAGAEMGPPSQGTSLPVAASGHVTSFPAVRSQTA